MAEGKDPPRLRVTDLGGDVAIGFGVWFVSVAVLNFFVGSPVTDVYVGLSIVAVAFYAGWRASRYFDDPPGHGVVALTDADEGRYRGTLSEDGELRFTGPDGREWTGTSWAGSWNVEDPEGDAWHGRVGRKGGVVIEHPDGRELRGTLTPG